MEDTSRRPEPAAPAPCSRGDVLMLALVDATAGRRGVIDEEPREGIDRNNFWIPRSRSIWVNLNRGKTLLIPVTIFHETVDDAEAHDGGVVQYPVPVA